MVSNYSLICIKRVFKKLIIFCNALHDLCAATFHRIPNMGDDECSHRNGFTHLAPAKIWVRGAESVLSDAFSIGASFLLCMAGLSSALSAASVYSR
ncbi:MAG: hypothetical protein COB71_00525 [Thiotrichales bacterium]|nr:MAG: hypothetical protein COB71_00525 [Thiotrichales bacterium]